MDDADLAGPFVFCFAFAFVLLLVSSGPTAIQLLSLAFVCFQIAPSGSKQERSRLGRT